MRDRYDVYLTEPDEQATWLFLRDVKADSPELAIRIARQAVEKGAIQGPTPRAIFSVFPDTKEGWHISPCLKCGVKTGGPVRRERTLCATCAVAITASGDTGRGLGGPM